MTTGRSEETVGGDVTHRVGPRYGDDAATGLLEQWIGQLDHENEMAHRDGESLVDLVHLQREQGFERGGGRVGHQEIETLLFGDDGIEGAANAVLVGEVHAERAGAGCQLRAVGYYGRGRLRVVAVGEDDPHPLAGQVTGCGGAETTAAAGYQRNSAIERT